MRMTRSASLNLIVFTNMWENDWNMGQNVPEATTATLRSISVSLLFMCPVFTLGAKAVKSQKSPRLSYSGRGQLSVDQQSPSTTATLSMFVLTSREIIWS